MGSAQSKQFIDFETKRECQSKEECAVLELTKEGDVDKGMESEKTEQLIDLETNLECQSKEECALLEFLACHYHIQFLKYMDLAISEQLEEMVTDHECLSYDKGAVLAKELVEEVDSFTKSKEDTPARQTSDISAMNRNSKENLDRREMSEDALSSNPTNTADAKTNTCRKSEDKNHDGDADGNTNKMQCEPCLFDNEDKKGVAFCVVCVEYLCKSCTRDHRKSKMTRGHNVLEEKEMPLNSDTFKAMKAMMSCTEHKDMQVKFKCEQHNIFICPSCLAVSHRKCEDVKEISTEEPRGDKSVNAISDSLNLIYDQTIALRKMKEGNITKLHENGENLKIKKAAFIQSLFEHISTLGERFDQEIETLLKIELEKMEKNVEECKLAESMEEKYKVLFDISTRYGSMVEQSVISEIVATEINGFKNKIEKLAEVQPVHIDFKETRDFTDISSIGNVHVNTEREKGSTNASSGSPSIIEMSSDILENVEMMSEGQEPCITYLNVFP